MVVALPHAVIVTGQRGEDLDRYLADKRVPGDEVLRIDEHLSPTKTSTGIYIEDIRDLQTSVRSARPGVRTIVVLQDAAKMTQQSQNALLKLLEEPRPGLHILLYTYTPMQLLDTVRSRCQTVVVRGEASGVELPADTAARITFMAGGIDAEMARLASDSRYFDAQTKLFEMAKQFIGGTAYERLVVAKKVGDKRDTALEFIDVTLRMYTTLLQNRFSPKLRDEAAALMDVEAAIRRNGNTKLQLLKFVVQ